MIDELMALDLSAFDEHNDRERCAVLVRTRNGCLTAREVPNRDAEPSKHFTIMKSDATKALWPGDEIIGSLHTHTRTSRRGLSYRDVAAMPDGMIGIMYRPVDRSRIIYNNKGPLQVVAGERRR